MATISGDFSTSLIAHWTMDETSGTRNDSTASAFNLSDNNTVLYGTGKQGNCADFEVDNVEYLGGGDWTGFDNVTKLSISAWIKLESIGAEARYIVTKWNNASQPAGSSFRLYVTSGSKLALDAYNSANGYVSGSGGTTLSTGTWYHIVMVWDSAATGNKIQMYVNGSAETMSLSGTVGTIKDTSTNVNVGTASDTDTGRRFDGLIDEVSVWSGRAITSSEVSTLYNSGNGIAYTTYALTAAYGSFSLTGQSTTLTAAYTITASAGSFTLTGEAADLLEGSGYYFTVAVGSFTLTGQDATLTKSGANTLTADYGSFTITGQGATITVGRIITAAQGSLTITGKDAGILATRTIGAEQGTYTFTEYDATTTRTVLLSAGQGSCSITGLDTAILRTSLLSPDVGNYTLAGQGSALLVARTISAGQGAYTLTGEDAQLLRGCALSAEYATYTISPQAAAILGTFILRPEVQTYTLTGYVATITQSGIQVVQSKKGKIVLSTRNTKMPLLTKTQRTKLF